MKKELAGHILLSASNTFRVMLTGIAMRHVICKGCGRPVEKRLFKTTTCRFCGRKRRPAKELALASCAILGSASLIGAVTIAAFSWQAARDLGYIESVKKPDVRFITDEYFDSVIKLGDGNGVGGAEKQNAHFITDDDMSEIESRNAGGSSCLTLFEDRIDGSKQYALTSRCATTVVITNNYDKEMHISRIRLEASEISVDEPPRIFASTIPTSDGIDLRLINNGWSPAENLIMSVTSKTGSLNEYFGKPSIEVLVPHIDEASDIRIPFLKKTDLIKHGSEDFALAATAKDDNYDDVSVVDFGFDFELHGDEFVHFGIGGPGERVYGVKVDTSVESFVYEDPISENVDPGRNICIPVCFFPDRSCFMKVKLSFEVSKGDMVETVSTEAADLHILVPSIYNLYEGVDLASDDSAAIEEFGIVDRRRAVVSYPFGGETVEY
ncbi:hypothetical protein [Gordonibacter massiliensis (ex Traore et al. 2017)]|uniref:hypothetical protein n=1 Tax=Gordonibacter massiliensis (ex Traore et al. 2017) TaxID=1841863 RepID=UPI001C8C5AE8|nr:hypothetical protein [Gordonibacter massiliensis (ex Traore et al. 2017)]MBX9034059.1 hypothetical protein [Gordonibacter massiliensis (ex Traore et al. 2017)]